MVISKHSGEFRRLRIQQALLALVRRPCERLYGVPLRGPRVGRSSSGVRNLKGCTRLFQQRPVADHQGLKNTLLSQLNYIFTLNIVKVKENEI